MLEWPTESEIVNEWIAAATTEKVANKARDLLLRVLQKRFPAGIPQDVRQLIADQPSQVWLHDWFDRALELPTMEDFRASITR